MRTEPEHFFVPPYVGARGWLGVMLDHGIDWERVVALVREAYEKVAPAQLEPASGKHAGAQGAPTNLVSRARSIR